NGLDWPATLHFRRNSPSTPGGNGLASNSLRSGSAGASATDGRSVGGGANSSEQLYGSLYGTLVKQATVLSYIDIFRLLAFLCLLCVPATLLFERVKKKAGAVPMH